MEMEIMLIMTAYRIRRMLVKVGVENEEGYSYSYKINIDISLCVH